MSEQAGGEQPLDIASLASEIVGAEPAAPGGEQGAGEQGGLPGSQPAPELRPLPKSWKKEMEGLWGKLPREVHDYVYEREGNVSKGIQAYRESHENWNSLLTPFQQVFQQHPDLKPRELFTNLMQTHLALTFGSPEQKRELARSIIQAYEIDGLEAIQQAKQQAAAQQQAQVDLTPLQRRIAGLEQQLYQRNLAETTAKVEKFFTDPANKYAKDLEEDILKIVASGERDLSAAYEKAMWLNPKVRERVIAERAAPGASQLNLKAGETSRSSPAPRKGTIEDTIDAIVANSFKT